MTARKLAVECRNMKHSLLDANACKRVWKCVPPSWLSYGMSVCHKLLWRCKQRVDSSINTLKTTPLFDRGKWPRRNAHTHTHSTLANNTFTTVWTKRAEITIKANEPNAWRLVTLLVGDSTPQKLGPQLRYTSFVVRTYVCMYFICSSHLALKLRSAIASFLQMLYGGKLCHLSFMAAMTAMSGLLTRGLSSCEFVFCFPCSLHNSVIVADCHYLNL